MRTIPRPPLVPPLTILACLVVLAFALFVAPDLCLGHGKRDGLWSFVVPEYETLVFHGDYSLPSPPPPVLPPRPPSLTRYDLHGVGSLDTVCRVNSSLIFAEDVYVEGSGSLDLLLVVTVSCCRRGCFILVNASGDFSLGENVVVSAGTLHVVASNGRLDQGSVVDVVGLAGEPPAQTSGTPQGVQGAGGGHGGRGANCVAENEKLPDDVCGGDVYSWSSLDERLVMGVKEGLPVRKRILGVEAAEGLSLRSIMSWRYREV